MRTPGWVHTEKPDAVDKASAKIQDDARLERLHVAGVGHLPVDREQAAFELTAEERVNRASRPKTRRWKALTRIDDELDRLEQQLAEAHQAVAAAEQAVRDAPAEDARTLAAWLENGQKGHRPESSLYEHDRGLAAARLLVEAAQLRVDEQLERRSAHIEKHKPQMLADAQADVDTARARLLELTRQLPELRDALLAARETLVWCASYPDQAEAFGNPTSAALGLRAPIEGTLGTRAQITYQALLQALEADATAISSAFSRTTAEQLGVAPPLNPTTGAMWDADVDPEWKRQQLEKLREAAQYPTSGDMFQPIRESEGLRPDP
jgi:DNA repair exonuclease SbcCD ATPase subunit